MDQHIPIDFLYYIHDLPEYKPPDRKIEDYQYKNNSIDAREWLPIPPNESEQARRERYNQQLHNTLVRCLTYRYIPETDNPKIMSYNSRNVYVTMGLSKLVSPTEEEINQMLIKVELPTSLQNYNIFDKFRLRLEYPYAWFNNNVPRSWVEQNDAVIRALDYGNFLGKGSNELNNALMQINVANRRDPNEYQLNIFYNKYMEILDQVPSLPNPIMLFRGINIPEPYVGQHITEYGLSSKSYFYFVAKRYSNSKCCILAISYPAGHNFLLQKSLGKRTFGEFVSYPGEVLQVDNIVEHEGKSVVFANFVGYVPHKSPIGEEIIPNKILQSGQLITANPEPATGVRLPIPTAQPTRLPIPTTGTRLPLPNLPQPTRLPIPTAQPTTGTRLPLPPIPLPPTSASLPRTPAPVPKEYKNFFR